MRVLRLFAAGLVLLIFYCAGYYMGFFEGVRRTPAPPFPDASPESLPAGATWL